MLFFDDPGHFERLWCINITCVWWAKTAWKVVLFWGTLRKGACFGNVTNHHLPLSLKLWTWPLWRRQQYRMLLEWKQDVLCPVSCLCDSGWIVVDEGMALASRAVWRWTSFNDFPKTERRIFVWTNACVHISEWRIVHEHNAFFVFSMWTLRRLGVEMLCSLLRETGGFLPLDKNCLKSAETKQVTTGSLKEAFAVLIMLLPT